MWRWQENFRTVTLNLRSGRVAPPTWISPFSPHGLASLSCLQPAQADTSIYLFWLCRYLRRYRQGCGTCTRSYEQKLWVTNVTSVADTGVAFEVGFRWSVADTLQDNDSWKPGPPLSPEKGADIPHDEPYIDMEVKYTASTLLGVHVASYAWVIPSYAEPPNILDVSDERPPKHPGCTAGTPPELFGELSPPGIQISVRSSSILIHPDHLKELYDPASFHIHQTGPETWMLRRIPFKSRSVRPQKHIGMGKLHWPLHTWMHWPTHARITSWNKRNSVYGLGSGLIFICSTNHLEQTFCDKSDFDNSHLMLINKLIMFLNTEVLMRELYMSQYMWDLTSEAGGKVKQTLSALIIKDYCLIIINLYNL